MIWGEPNFVVQNNKKPVIMYPCSMNHFSLPGSKLSGGDIQGTFLNFIRKTVDVYDWNFIGGLPNELVDLKTQGKLKQHPWLSVYEYPAFLKSLKADVAIAPLVKNLFNECKSNIKVLEYVATGVPGVYTNIYPYYNCFQRADTDEEMIEKIEALIKSPDLRKQTWERDYASVKNQLFWEENNNLIEYFNQHLRLFGREIQFELG
jgi:glycosyltransferase involved in cell wall biosynthesis